MPAYSMGARISPPLVNGPGRAAGYMQPLIPPHASGPPAGLDTIPYLFAVLLRFFLIHFAVHFSAFCRGPPPPALYGISMGRRYKHGPAGISQITPPYTAAYSTGPQV